MYIGVLKAMILPNLLLKKAFHPLPHIPILGSSNSAAIKNTMSEIWTNGVQLSAQPSTGETQESMNNVSCRRDMTKILLKAA